MAGAHETTGAGASILAILEYRGACDESSAIALDPLDQPPTAGRQLKPEEVGKVRAELERYQEFAELTGQIAEVSEAICDARPVPVARAGQAPEPEGQKDDMHPAGPVAG